MAVHVFTLGHVDASDSVAHLLGLPGGHPAVAAEGGFDVVFGSFVYADFVWVEVGVAAVELVRSDFFSLESAIL